MIEITPVSTMPPIKRINKVTREQQQSTKQNTSQQPENDNKDDPENEQAQHIDEIV